MKKVFLFLVLLLSSEVVQAQVQCLSPQLTMNGKQVKTSTSGPFSPTVVLALQKNAACAGTEAYEIKTVEVTLVRSKRPLYPVKISHSPTLDLAGWQATQQPGDRIYMELKQVVVVDAKGERKAFAGAPIALTLVLQ